MLTLPILASLEVAHVEFVVGTERMWPQRQQGYVWEYPCVEISTLSGCPELCGDAGDCGLHTSVSEHSGVVGV